MRKAVGTLSKRVYCEGKTKADILRYLYEQYPTKEPKQDGRKKGYGQAILPEPVQIY